MLAARSMACGILHFQRENYFEIALAAVDNATALKHSQRAQKQSVHFFHRPRN